VVSPLQKMLVKFDRGLSTVRKRRNMKRVREGKTNQTQNRGIERPARRWSRKGKTEDEIRFYKPELEGIIGERQANSIEGRDRRTPANSVGKSVQNGFPAIADGSKVQISGTAADNKGA